VEAFPVDSRKPGIDLARGRGDALLIMKQSLALWVVLIPAVVRMDAAAVSPTPLIRAHAHNDYEHARPLFDALDQGFCSVEADVHLVDGRLLVTHASSGAQSGRTLRGLYLDPLRRRAQQNSGRVYREGPSVTLLVDIKGDAEATYEVLRRQLAEYTGMLANTDDPEGLRALLSRRAASTDEPAEPPSPNRYPATVRMEAGQWIIQGRQHRVTFTTETLEVIVKTPRRLWPLAPSSAEDLRVRDQGCETSLQLSKARHKTVTPFRTGYSAGIRIELRDFGSDKPDPHVRLSLALEGSDEDLVAELIGGDPGPQLVECSWPYGFREEAFDVSVIPYMQGVLLPKDWPERVWLYDSLSYGRGLYMPWWGHQQGDSAVLVLLETPADGGCRFQHAAGGPTRMQVRWVSSLGQWAYPRRARFCFIESGDYVQLAKRYRRYAMETAHFVSLREKIARNPRVGELLGVPIVHTSILHHIQPDSSYYQTNDLSKNHQWVTFEQRARDLEELSERGVERAYVHVDGWGVRGYDNLHPDILPPCPEAGGWDGMRGFAETCQRLGFVFAIHDQYRDFYLDAATYDPELTLIQANGQRPHGSTWYGGKQSILCPRFAPGYVRRNHQAILGRGIPLRGAYLDVFAVVPPEECYHPDHPVSRSACLEYRGEALDSVRAWDGIVSSEEPSDWAIPHLDLVHHGPYPLRPNPGRGPAMAVPIPLFNLVYHDALLIPWSLGRGAWGIPEEDLGYLHGLGNAGLPYLSLKPSKDELEKVRTLSALHRRVGLLELTDHAFLDETRRQQQFTYSDETKVTIDLEEETFVVSPPL